MATNNQRLTLITVFIILYGNTTYFNWVLCSIEVKFIPVPAEFFVSYIFSAREVGSFSVVISFIK